MEYNSNIKVHKKRRLLWVSLAKKEKKKEKKKKKMNG